MNSFVKLDKIRSQEEFNKLVQLAKDDNHGVYQPTQVVRRGDEVLGYFSIGAPGVPVVLAWLSTKELKPRESFSLINMVECHVTINGAHHVAFPVPKDSPFHPVMGSMGYKLCGNYDFFVKET